MSALFWRSGEMHLRLMERSSCRASGRAPAVCSGCVSETCEERGLRFLARAAEAVLSRSLAKSQPVCALQAVPEDLGHARATLGQAGAAHLGVPLN